MDLDIGRDTLLAIVATAWADGHIDPREAASVKSACSQLGLNGTDCAAVDQALTRGFTLNEVETIRMNRLTRLFTYAASCWIAEVDGALSEPEKHALGVLGDRLGLSALARERAHGVALSLSQSATPDAFDLMKLRAQLSAGLSQISDE
jgi:uncharacterized membrane protein YebE (DUF533 family)